jgi:uncharacterized protein
MSWEGQAPSQHNQDYGIGVKLSSYYKILPGNETTDDCIFFSTKKAAMIQAPRALLEDVSNNNLPADEEETLRRLGFLVADATSEHEEMLGFMKRLNSANKRLSITAVLNLDCNLACKYCFEGNRKGRFYMSQETAALFLDFISLQDLSEKEEIKVVFYGGEPLLSMELIIHLSKEIKAIADRKGVGYKFSLITNGTLLTPGVVEKLKPLGMTSAGVTLDGPREVHDLLRPFKSGRGSFDAIVKNLKKVCSMLSVQIGGNFTKASYDKVPYLLDYLLESGLTPDKVLGVKFDPVTRESDEFALADFHDGCASPNEPWLFDASLFVREEILKRGYPTPRIMPIACALEYRDSIVVNYDGSIYKCTGFIGRESLQIGDIRNGIKDYPISHNLDNWKNKECLDCAYLPLCFGGCRYMKYVRDGNMDGVDCRKPYLDATLETLVKQDIRHGLIK